MRFLSFVFVLISLIVLALADSQVIRAPLKPAHVYPHIPRRVPQKINPRITGGEEAEPHSIPYQAGLFITTPDGVNFCGASLITTTTLITAAHCGEISNDIEVVLGAHKIRENEDTQVRINASEVIVHEEWDRLTLSNDIAILRLPNPVELNDNIQLIPLPSRSDVSNDYAGDVALASGWGKDSDASDSISPVLRKVEVPVASNIACGLYYLGIITDSQVCVATDGGKSTCNGDSGGPLRASDGKLIGLTSFGISFGCEAGWPAVFTRITSYLDWIADNSDAVIN